ncbi:hypothetical protein [Kitasatospora sp. MAP5-34]|uniref:DUF6891 domain-containing protein n=1 Tax=Kitasatospora sp. MAP5-34 TaxID=3035102 RepID=UPI0024732AE5|nr:hypothetical protein [Kitasatospora sp. MAP5-34]MDH6575036.1 hypothetical protein [Kitasatospora sp. MAP5-34]
MTEIILDLDPELVRDAEERARELIRCGFLEQDELAEVLLDSFDDAGLDVEHADEIVAPLWEARLAEQESWPEVTDVDRLAEAFDALEAQGIVAEMDFTCCARCGYAEIGAEGDEDSHGFVFFHEQDTERAAAGEGLTLRYGAFKAEEGADETGASDEETAEETAAIGRAVVAALAKAGLRTQWDGSPDEVIVVTPLNWQNRLPE